MLSPWAITIRRPSGEADFILTRVEDGAEEGRKSSCASPQLPGMEESSEDDKNSTIPFQRPKANSSSCITDGIKSRLLPLNFAVLWFNAYQYMTE